MTSPLSRPPDPGLLEAIFVCSPWGVVVLNDERQVVAASPAAERLLGPGAAESTCCRIFGCRAPGTPLEGVCVTRLALAEQGDAIPEIRLDLGQNGDERSVWVIAAALEAGEHLVVVHVRPGIAGDRRRRTEPHWTRGPQLRIRTLGRTRVESAEAPLSGEWLGHRPGELFKYLVCHRDRIVPSDELIEVFWHDVGHSAISNVRQAIHTLRERLEPGRHRHAPSSFIAVGKGGYQLEVGNVSVDADEFEAGIERGLTAARTGDAVGAEEVLASTLRLYEGDFLADEPYADWVLAERERLRSLASKGLRTLAELRRDRGDVTGAVEAQLGLAELQPLDLDVQRELLRLLLRAGQTTGASRRLEVFRRRYHRVFGIDPGIELGELLGEAGSSA